MMLEMIEENLQRFSKKLQRFSKKLQRFSKKLQRFFENLPRFFENLPRFFDMLYDVAVIIENRNICWDRMEKRKSQKIPHRNAKLQWGGRKLGLRHRTMCQLMGRRRYISGRNL